jgi:hypothetical protein
MTPHEKIDKFKKLQQILTWKAALETGGVLVADQVQISLDIQASKA